MKRLLLIAALAAAPAMADSWAIVNKNGGEIVITDRVCQGYKNLKFGYSYSQGGKSLSGCWIIIEDMVHFIYDDGTVYTYPVSSFYKKSSDKKGTSL
jgi:hypothetical protein